MTRRAPFVAKRSFPLLTRLYLGREKVVLLKPTWIKGGEGDAQRLLPFFGGKDLLPEFLGFSSKGKGLELRILHSRRNIDVLCQGKVTPGTILRNGPGTGLKTI